MKIRYLKTVCGADGSFYAGDERDVDDETGLALCRTDAAAPVVDRKVERAVVSPTEVREGEGSGEASEAAEEIVEPKVPMPSPSGGRRRR